MSRRAHSKSRHGCSSCKRRRVKCDSIRPICSHCERRREVCEYMDTVIEVPSQLHRTSPYPTRSSIPIADRGVETWPRVVRSLPTGSLEGADQTPLPNAFSKPNYPGFELNLNQLKLMLNWNDEASLTMALDESPARTAVWSRVVPMLATDHPFLMHGLLAVSAAHIAYSRPEMGGSYLPMARQHYELGSRMFQDLGMPESPSHAQSLQEAKVVFILMNSVLSIALMERTTHAERDLNSFMNWLMLLRSSFDSARRLYEESLSHNESRISALLRGSKDGPPELSALDEGMAASLDLLDARNRKSETTSPIDKEHVSDAIAKIRLWVRLVSLRPQTAMFIAHCAINLTEDFFRLVKERDPVSLIAMAHLLVPMCHIPKKWFWSDWFQAAMATILQVLPIGQWYNNLSWVLEQVDVSHFVFQKVIQ